MVMVTDYGRKTPLLQAKAGFMLILRWKRAFSHAHPALDNSRDCAGYGNNNIMDGFRTLQRYAGDYNTMKKTILLSLLVPLAFFATHSVRAEAVSSRSSIEAKLALENSLEKRLKTNTIP